MSSSDLATEFLKSEAETGNPVKPVWEEQSKPLRLLPAGGNTDLNKARGERNVFHLASHLLEPRLPGVC